MQEPDRIPLHTQTTALPEIRDRQQFLIVCFLLEAQDKFKVPDSLIGGFLRHRDHPFRHAQMKIMVQRQVRAHGERIDRQLS